MSLSTVARGFIFPYIVGTKKYYCRYIAMSTKNHPLQIRLKEHQRKQFEKAAKAKGLPLSTWIKMVCKQQAESDGFKEE